MRPATGSRLALVMAWLGTTSVGGRSTSYLMEELVYRRHWLRPEDFLEGKTLAKLLPGPTGPSTMVFAIQSLYGARVAALCLAPYVLPGAVLGLVLSVMLLNGERPAWVNSALRGFSCAALGLIIANSLRTAGSIGKARFGPLLVGVTIVAHGLIGIDLLTVFLGVGGVSLLLNRPRRGTDHG